MKAITDAPEATKGEIRTIRTESGYVQVKCAMLLGMAFDSDSGKEYRECIWHRLDNGLSIHGAA